MAKTKNITHKNVNINYENSVIIGNKKELEDELKKEVLKELENKKIKVVFKRNVISDFGTFAENQEAELEEKKANKMINGGYAVRC